MGILEIVEPARIRNYAAFHIVLTNRKLRCLECHAARMFYGPDDEAVPGPSLYVTLIGASYSVENWVAAQGNVYWRGATVAELEALLEWRQAEARVSSVKKQSVEAIPDVKATVRVRKTLDCLECGDGAKYLEEALLKLVVGQREAIQAIVSTYQTHLAGLSAPGRPVGNFLFLGPTGSGKTRTVEATALALVGNARAVVKVDCAEFQHSHEIAKLIGSPPGYLGHRETHAALSQEALQQCYTDKIKLSFVLFDEIEKASDALWNLLLGILDKGLLTLGDNRKVDFSQCLIFMTSNLGAKEMSEKIAPKLGFHSGTPNGAIRKEITNCALEAAKRKFTPEFMNRIDKTVVFTVLAEPELRQVLDLELAQVQERLLRARGSACVLSLSTAAKDLLLREGIEFKYGARHLKRAIERLLVTPLANVLASAQLRSGACIHADVDTCGSRLVFTQEYDAPEELAHGASKG